MLARLRVQHDRSRQAGGNAQAEDDLARANSGLARRLQHRHRRDVGQHLR
jgi:hypothetical protein